MPYSIRKGGGSCSKAEWAVVKTSTGKSVGCHKTKGSARKQLAALQINVMSKEGAMQQVHETATLAERATQRAGGRWSVVAISAGLGSSGYYSPKVLENAAANQLIEAGTPLFFDHASESERSDRPERSVRDIAAVFTTPAAYDASQEALVGEVQVFGPYRELVTEMAPHIGLSISGSATDITEGTIDGRRVPVIEDLFAISSVDLVTKAGRGGQFVSLLESARAETNRQADDAHHGLEVDEATYSDKQTALCDAVKNAYGKDKTYAWVRDFDDETVWFEISTSDSEGLYGQTYTFDAASGEASLTGSRTEVRAVTNYVPATRPGGNTTTESQENHMGQKTIEESEFTRLTEAAGRVDTLEAELNQVKAALAEATKPPAEEGATPVVTGPRAVVQKHITEQDDRIARLEAREGARQVIAEVLAEGWIGDAQKARLSVALMGDLPMADGKLDEQALRTKATDLLNEAETETAEILEHAGVGEVRGLGGLTTPAIEVAGKKFEDELTESFQRRGLSESAAQIAVKGH
jgi:hypothetical protein